MAWQKVQKKTQTQKYGARIRLLQSPFLLNFFLIVCVLRNSFFIKFSMELDMKYGRKYQSRLN